MTDSPKRHVIADPYPETIGVTALTIFAPEDFRGDAEINWWYPGKSADVDRQRMTCNCVWLLQGVFHDVRGSRPLEDLLGIRRALFDTRIVALVVHEFYRQRIARAANLEAAYEWMAY